MNWKLLFFVALIGTMLSCNKFEHESFEVPNCELCDYAKTIEGTYRGLAYGTWVPTSTDSMTLTLEQIFLGNSQYEDSTYMRLRVHCEFDSSLDSLTGSMRLEDASGISPNGGYVLTADSIVFSYDDLANPSTSNPALYGTFYRQ